MEITQSLYVTMRAAWRAWLAENHAQAAEIWLIFYKRHTGQPSLPYDDAVEEALCFGWIDSLVRRLDDERYAQKFTPRRPKSPWSESNRQRVARLLAAGQMTEAGLKTLTFLQGEAPASPPKLRDLPLPAEFQQEMERHGVAWENFKRMAASYRQRYIAWISSARRPETRAKRIAEAVELLALNQKLGMK